MNSLTMKLKAGKKYSICSCGLSKSLPYCDNEHREFNTENGTNYKSVKIIAAKDCDLLLKSSNWKGNKK